MSKISEKDKNVFWKVVGVFLILAGVVGIVDILKLPNDVVQDNFLFMLGFLIFVMKDK